MSVQPDDDGRIPAGWEMEPAPSVNVVGLCHLCARRSTTNSLVCQAYPDGIPWEILAGDVDHRKPYTGDHGLQFIAANDFPLDRENDPEDPPDNHVAEEQDS